MSIETWKRQQGETAKQYSYFKAYLDLGPQRSLEEAGKKLDRNWKYLGELSARFDWVLRAEAYDTYLSVQEQLATEKQIEQNAKKWAARQEQIREEGWALYEALKAKAELMLRFPVQRTKVQGTDTYVEPADWNFNTAARLADTALKLGRLTAELSTENINLEKVNWKDLTPEQLERIKRGESIAAVLRS